MSNIEPTESYDAVEAKVTAEISRHFKLVLNRPEILNRIGENVIVFDFIRDDIATQIFDQMVATSLADLEEQELHVSLSSESMASLRQLCLKDLSNGGRGIRNQVEANLLNPLARNLFDLGAKPGDRFVVHSLEPASLTLNRV